MGYDCLRRPEAEDNDMQLKSLKLLIPTLFIGLALTAASSAAAALLTSQCRAPDAPGAGGAAAVLRAPLAAIRRFNGALPGLPLALGHDIDH